MQAGLSTKNAPSPSVVLPHYAVGAVAFLIASIMLLFVAKDLTLMSFGPKVLSITHLLILGWVTIIIYGALYQLIPVVMEVKLFNENLAYVSFVTIVTGLSLMVYSFWGNYIGSNVFVETGGSLVIVSVLLFVVNAVGSAIKSTNRNIENSFIISSIVWLLLTVILGFLIIINGSTQWIPRNNLELLKIHLGFGLIGWFMMLIIGVGSTLLPMFFIAHKLNRKYLKASFYVINSGLILLSISEYLKFNVWISSIFATAIAIGIFLFVRYNYDAYKKRLRRKLDIGMKLSVYSFIFLFIALITGVLSATGIFETTAYATQIQLSFGVSLILGFFTSLILGQMYKTLPFIVWLQKYQDKVGKFKIPLPNDLYNEKIADLHFYTFIIGAFTLLAGIWLKNEIIIQISAVFYIATAVLFTFNTFKIILHKENIQELNIKK